MTPAIPTPTASHVHWYAPLLKLHHLCNSPPWPEADLFCPRISDPSSLSRQWRFFLYTLTPPLPYLSHAIISIRPLYCARSLCLSLSSNYWITSPLSLLETWFSIFSISPPTLFLRCYYLFTLLRSACSTPLHLVFLHFPSLRFNRIWSSPSAISDILFPLRLLSDNILFIPSWTSLINLLCTAHPDQIGFAWLGLALLAQFWSVFCSSGQSNLSLDNMPLGYT